MIAIKLLNEFARMPYRANETDAGADLFATEDMIIQPMQRKLVSTGIALQIPKYYYGRIAPRSGLAVNYGIDVLAGVVDSSYRGEIKVVLINTDQNKEFEIKKGDKIAQLIIESHYNFQFLQVEDLQATNRGSGGFGSTGK